MFAVAPLMQGCVQVWHKARHTQFENIMFNPRGNLPSYCTYELVLMQVPYCAQPKISRLSTSTIHKLHILIKLLANSWFNFTVT